MKYQQTTAITPRDGEQAAPQDKLDLGQLNNHLGYFLRRSQVRVFQDFTATFKKIKLRPAQYSVLLVIDANPGKSQAMIDQKTAGAIINTGSKQGITCSPATPPTTSPRPG